MAWPAKSIRNDWCGHARRSGIVLGVIAGHACVLMLMAWEMRPKAVETGNQGTLIMASLVSALPAHAAATPARSAAKPAKAKADPARPTQPSDAPSDVQPEAQPPATPDTPELNDADSEALAQFQPSAQGEPDAPCDLTSNLASAFAQSPAVRQGLDELPDTQRSVANAVMLWDGQWPQESLSGGKALLRGLLVKALSTARPDCLGGQNHGPVLLRVPEDSRTAVLAIGSGEWSWGQLLQAEPTPPTDYFLSAASGFPPAP